MSRILTAGDAKQSLHAHAAARGAEIFAKYGPRLDWDQLQLILEDRECVRYPCRLLFGVASLQPGEMAFAQPKGPKPEEGYAIHLHPLLLTRLDRAVGLVLYQLVVVNYGGFAAPEDAEAFGAAALGLPRDEYYQSLCDLADWFDSQNAAPGPQPVG